MLQNLFNLKTHYNEIYFIKGEVKLFNSIDQSIIKEFKKILIKLNNKKINFKIYKKGMNTKYLISFLDNQIKNFYPLNYKYQWSNYNFFKNYFKNYEYKYNPKIFHKINASLDRFSIWEVKKIFPFLPFYFKKPHKKSKEFINRFFPSIYYKGSAFSGEKHFMGFHGHYYEKTKYIKTGTEKVISFLKDSESKENYKMMLKGNANENYFHYFKKAHFNYQYSDYIKLDRNSVVLNCGVESGEEIKLYNNVKKIYNIDPGKDGYLDKSVKYILKKTKTKNYFLGYALYTNDGVYTKLEKNLKNKVKTLKEIVKIHKINKIDLIKSDIEGAERYMVNDLIDICKRFNSQLAISIYHTNQQRKKDEELYDTVNIPLKLIDKLKSKYDFHFNIYGYERWEGVLYCIPKFG